MFCTSYDDEQDLVIEQLRRQRRQRLAAAVTQDAHGAAADGRGATAAAAAAAAAAASAVAASERVRLAREFPNSRWGGPGPEEEDGKSDVSPQVEEARSVAKIKVVKGWGDGRKIFEQHVTVVLQVQRRALEVMRGLMPREGENDGQIGAA